MEYWVAPSNPGLSSPKACLGVASTNNVLIKSPIFGRIYKSPVTISTVFNFELKTQD